MRFSKDGPSIPDQLLERRDQGRVVFLCGAGVSLNAGMPTFSDLTKYVFNFFDPPRGSPIELAFHPWMEDEANRESNSKIPLDQIFHMLYQEYGREEVNALVSRRLRGEHDTRPLEKKGVEHKIIAKISSDREGKPQIVTTNFDRLFEAELGNEAAIIYTPPALPDINLGVPLTGITYLHGRLQDREGAQPPFVLSSADFGRAYLSEGWATNFIRSLLKSYTVVLVGYKAEDPPVKYLLQGLNHDGLSDRSNLYAFDRGEPEEVEAKWRDRGVTAIACSSHESLWQGLENWAARAANPRLWRSGVIEMAMKGPRQLAAHERGQVASCVRTVPGARLFAGTNPPPPSEWLCVFDAWCRVGKKSSSFGENAETFDPFEAYGLDEDPPRLSEEDRNPDYGYDHILEWRRGDTNPSAPHRLSGMEPVGSESMPPRLSHLCTWITKHLDSPITAWWAVRQSGLHPRLLKNIRAEIRRNENLHPEARRTWNLIVEYHADNRDVSGNDWFDIQDRIKAEGWTQSVLRGLEAATAPFLSARPPYGIRASQPPFGDWEEDISREIVQWEVKFPKQYGEDLDVPDEILGSVFRIFERHLARAAGLLDDIKTFWFDAPSCYPGQMVEDDHDLNAMFRLFLNLFARMVDFNPVILRAYASAWPLDEKFYFRRLKLFALNHANLFGPEEAAECLLALSQEGFWDRSVRRELLFLIRDRWDGFSVSYKTELGARLLDGPPEIDSWAAEKNASFRTETACCCARWLTLQGKVLVGGQRERLTAMISSLPEWEDKFASYYLEDHGGSVGRLATDESPKALIDLRDSLVVEHTQQEAGRDFDSPVERRPFIGLVKANPRKALASLSIVARRGEYPLELWSTLISNWPEETRSRLYCVYLRRLCCLPYEVICELRFPVGRWLQDKIVSAYKFNEALAWKTFDHLIAGLISNGGIATGSASGEVRLGGVLIERSRRTLDHAMNGPIGCAMEGLLQTLDAMKLGEGVGIPHELKFRLEGLIDTPGEASDHAIAILARQISWLYYLDPDWIYDRVIPWFSLDHHSSEPAWNGYLSAGKIFPHEIGKTLKTQLLNLFPIIYTWSWDEHLASIAAQLVTDHAVFRSDKPDGLNAKEARHCLRSMNDRNRQNVIQMLSRIGKEKDDGWAQHVIPFINTVWPRERKFRTSSLVSAWVSLLSGTNDKFPEVLASVRRFLVPVHRQSHWLYQFSREIGGNQTLTVRFPVHVLELLDAVIPNSAEGTPYELAQILGLIEETDPSLVSDRRFVRLIELIEQT